MLKTQALHSKTNDGFAFLSDRFNEAIESSISSSGLEATKVGASALIEKRLPKTQNFPSNPKVAAEFTALVTSSLNSAIETRAIELGQAPVRKPVAANKVEEVSKTKEKLVTIGN
jgi:hypothetical protein